MNVLEKLREDMRAAVVDRDPCECPNEQPWRGEHRALRVLDDFIAEWRTVEVREWQVGSSDHALLLPGDNLYKSKCTDVGPLQTILVPRKEPTLLEAAEAMAEWMEKGFHAECVDTLTRNLRTAIMKERDNE